MLRRVLAHYTHYSPNGQCFAMRFFLSVFPHLIFALFFLSFLLQIDVVSQIRGHKAGPSPLSPLRAVLALHFYRENTAALPSSTPMESRQTALLGAVRVFLTRRIRQKNLLKYQVFGHLDCSQNQYLVDR